MREPVHLHNVIRSTILCLGVAAAVFAHGSAPAAGEPARVRLQVQSGHAGGIFAIDASANALIASAGLDRTVKVWHRSSGRLLVNLNPGFEHVDGLRLLPDGSRVLVTGKASAGCIVSLDIATDQETARFGAKPCIAKGLAVSSDGSRLAAMVEGESGPTVFDAATLRPVRRIAQALAWDNLALSPDGKRIAFATGARGESIAVWDVEQGVELLRWQHQASSAPSLQFAGGGSVIAAAASSAGGDSLTLWSASTGQRLALSGQVTEGISRLSASRDGSRLAFMTTNGSSVGLVDVSRRELRSQPVQGFTVFNLALTPDAATLAVVLDQNLLASFDSDFSNGRLFSVNALMANGLRFAEGNLVALSGYGLTQNFLERWSLGAADHTALRLNTSHSAPQLAIAPRAARELKEALDDRPLAAFDMFPDGRRVALATDGLSLFSLPEGHRLWSGKDHTVNPFAPLHVAGDFIAATTSTHAFRLFDAASGAPLRAIGPLEQKTLMASAVSSDGRWLAAETMGGDAAKRLIRVWSAAGGEAVFRQELPADAWSVNRRRLALSPDGRWLAAGVAGGVRLWDLRTSRAIDLAFDAVSPAGITAIAFAGDGLAAGDAQGRLAYWGATAEGWQLRWTEQGHAGAAVTQLAFESGGKHLASAAADGSVIVWEPGRRAWIAKCFAFPDGAWIVVDFEGRFDTNRFDGSARLQWIAADAPTDPLPIDLFARDYYEPRLLQRLVAGERLPPVPEVAARNRALPRVTIVDAAVQPDGTAEVVVEVASGEHHSAKGMRSTTGASDLHLLRDGQLVATALGSAAQALPASAGSRKVRFSGIRLPSGRERVNFSAYAFNDDGIRSALALRPLGLPPGAARAGKAFIVTMGVDAYENPSWNLRYAANDARSLATTLESALKQQRRFAEIVSIPLLSQSGAQARGATKAQLSNTLASLAKRITPDDLLILSFSGHGYGQDGRYYLLPSDIGPGLQRQVTPELLRRAISTDELAASLRSIDAAEIVVIIDACYSAGAVGAGFRPAPMGNRGLGQLAYDKGLRILAASQADDEALESDKLSHGLLTFALLKDGIEAFAADYQPRDGAISLGEWLQYGAARVPELYAQIKSGSVAATRGAKVQLPPNFVQAVRARRVQQPAVFDFAARPNDFQLLHCTQDRCRSPD